LESTWLEISSVALKLGSDYAPENFRGIADSRNYAPKNRGRNSRFSYAPEKIYSLPNFVSFFSFLPYVICAFHARSLHLKIGNNSETMLLLQTTINRK